MSQGFNPNDYIDVAARITQFYEKYPDGRLTTVDWDVKPDLDGKTFVWVHAKAYRTPDDPLPGDGIAWEPVPGPTSFTRDSELMNAQTAAIGRAIVSLGFDTKKIASADEVRARQPENNNGGDPLGLQAARADAPTASGSGDATDKQKGMIRRLEKKLNLEPTDVDSLAKAQASALIERLLAAESVVQHDVPAVAGGSVPDDIPFQ